MEVVKEQGESLPVGHDEADIVEKQLQVAKEGIMDWAPNPRGLGDGLPRRSSLH
jgi:hypothetical protein